MCGALLHAGAAISIEAGVDAHAAQQPDAHASAFAFAREGDLAVERLRKPALHRTHEERPACGLAREDGQHDGADDASAIIGQRWRARRSRSRRITAAF